MMHYTQLEDLYDKFGGKFRFSVMIQKRVAQLVVGERKLVPGTFDDPISIAIAEAREAKIWLEEDELVTAETGKKAAAAAK
jgi:DNA-directed RNA polymerase subunit K/omega